MLNSYLYVVLKVHYKLESLLYAKDANKTDIQFRISSDV